MAEPDKGTTVIVVDGAEGFLGGAVVEALLGMGRKVRALVLDSGPDARGERASLPAGAELFAAPLDNTADEPFAEALKGACAVVAARRIEYERPRAGLTYARVHAERTERLLAAAKKAGVGRFVYAGYAGIDGRVRSPLAEAEREVKAHLIASGLPALYLNLPIIVGPGDGTVSRMVARAASRWPVITFVGQGWTKAAPLTREDFAGCVAALLAMDDFPTGELDIAGPEALTVMDIQDRLLQRAGRRKAKLHVIASVARLLEWTAGRLLSHPTAAVSGTAWMLEEHVPKRNAVRKLLGRKPDRFEAAFG